MNDGEALLPAVLIDPADDAPRPVYADFLDERGEAARAEFIRVQIRREAERGEPGPLPPDVGGPLAVRERRLWAAHGPAWEDEFGAWLPPARTPGPFRPPYMAPPVRGWGCRFRRGFCYQVKLFPKAFLTPRAAARLFGSAPLTVVFLYGRDPELDGGHFCWHLPHDRTPMSEDSTILPQELFALLDGMTNPADPAGDEFAYYPDPASALNALSRACVRYGRAAAGLPPLPGQDSGGRLIPHER